MRPFLRVQALQGQPPASYPFVMTSPTLQNRVDPWGRLCADPSRGALMGNRGILHDDANNIVRPWAHKAWVTCLLEFKGVKRTRPFSRGNYSELFFIDEATAFAAGHRPCAYCQRQRHLAFKEAWLRANMAEESRAATSMKEVDAILHAERAIRGGGKMSFDAMLRELPSGVIFEHEQHAYLVSSQRTYLRWSFGGYAEARDIEPTAIVKVLTPRSIVRAFGHGFSPLVHASVPVRPTACRPPA